MHTTERCVILLALLLVGCCADHSGIAPPISNPSSHHLASPPDRTPWPNAFDRMEFDRDMDGVVDLVFLLHNGGLAELQSSRTVGLLELPLPSFGDVAQVVFERTGRTWFTVKSRSGIMLFYQALQCGSTVVRGERRIIFSSDGTIVRDEGKTSTFSSSKEGTLSLLDANGEALYQLRGPARNYFWPSMGTRDKILNRPLAAVIDLYIKQGAKVP